MMGLLNHGLELKVVEDAEPPQAMMDMPGFKDELRRPMMPLVTAISRKNEQAHLGETSTSAMK